MSPPPILDMFYDIIRKLPFDLEQLTPSVVQCGVHIMDYAAPPSPWKASGKSFTACMGGLFRPHPEPLITDKSILPCDFIVDAIKKHGPKSPNERACELGASILAETFKVRIAQCFILLSNCMRELSMISHIALQRYI